MDTMGIWLGGCGCISRPPQDKQFYLFPFEGNKRNNHALKLLLLFTPFAAVLDWANPWKSLRPTASLCLVAILGAS
jgi:hypothetical protein